MKYLLVSSLVFLAGCCIPKAPDVVTNKVLVAVPCNVTMPDKPVMPLTDGGDVKDNIFVKSQKALAEIELRKSYEAQLEAAAGSCK